MNGLLLVVVSALGQCQAGSCAPAQVAYTYAPVQATYQAPAYQQTGCAPVYQAPACQQAGYVPVRGRWRMRGRFRSNGTYQYRYSGSYSGYAAVGGPFSPYSDPNGFVASLNAVRAGMGRGPVALDAGLSGWCAANNAQQQRRGMGHWVRGYGRYQDSAMGHPSTYGNMWLASDDHNPALTDPSITTVGIAWDGQYGTLESR